MKDFIIKMLSSDSAISSKRVSGFVGWLTNRLKKIYKRPKECITSHIRHIKQRN